MAAKRTQSLCWYRHGRRNRGALGARAHKDFSVNKEVPFLFLENAPFYLGKKCPLSVVPPMFEMLPTSLGIEFTNLMTFTASNIKIPKADLQQAAPSSFQPKQMYQHNCQLQQIL